MPQPSDNPPAESPNVLRDAVFTVERDGGREIVALPRLISLLLHPGGGVLRVPRPAAEQFGPVWRFLVRCAGEALRTLGRGLPDADEDLDVLAAEVEHVLAERAGGLEAWNLYDPDPTHPAFLQPPVPDSGSFSDAGFKPDTTARLALVVGGKRHEHKADADRMLDAESLIAALITFQSGVIYTKGNYSSQLMGSATGKGSGSPFMGARLGGSLDTTFRHDVGGILGHWDEIRRERGLRGAIWALWAERWDGGTSIPASKLDPAFIPCARLIRVGMPESGGRWSAVWFRSTKVARVVDHTEGSGLGDPFLPLVAHPKRPGDWKARGTMATGYRYDEIVRLLFGDEERPAAPSPSVRALLGSKPPEGARVHFAGVAFDQGKTLGFHHREILVPAGNYDDFEAPGNVRQLHREFLSIVKDAQSALRGAARILLHGSPAPRKNDRAKVEAGADALQHMVDAIYVDRLLAAARAHRAGDHGHLDGWRSWVRAQAIESFETVRDSVPTPTTTRYRREIESKAFLSRKLAVPQASSSLNDSGHDDHTSTGNA